MPQHTRADIFTALAQKAGFEVVSEKETAKQLRIVGRCHPNRWAFFIQVIGVLLKASDGSSQAWTCDISKNYMLQNDRLLYSWRLILQGDGLAQHYGQIAATIRGAPSPARVEVNEVLLPGYKPGQMRGGVNAKGKGIASAGSSPMILNRGRFGE